VQDRGLPTYPAKGDRRNLDEAWLDQLHRDGIAGHLKEVPEPPPELGQAIEEFNQGQYWQCHETLESIWLPEQYPLRLFYHALIKAAVGLLHLKRRNRHGALVKLGDTEHALAPFIPEFMGIETGRLRQDIKDRWEYVRVDFAADWDTIENLPPVQIRSREVLH
jgi:hypothetical protein